jgi:membrane-associated phospholipid phosphatase
MKKLSIILLLNLLGVLIVASWHWELLLPWSVIDDGIFFFFNQFVGSEYPRWDELLALLNTRYFDGLAFALMALMFVYAIYLDKRPQRWLRWFGIGFTMLFTAGVLALFTLRGIHYEHVSPTLFYDHAHRLTDVVSIPTKDSSGNSFPGDHGLMLMVFAAFMLRFAQSRVAWLSVAFVVLLSAPRIMVGAHWFSDIYMGSLAIALIALPWVLLTPLGPRCVQVVVRTVSRFYRFNKSA